MKMLAPNTLHSFACFALVAVILSSSKTPGFTQNQPTSNYFEDGVSKTKQGDFQGAIAAYDEAIQLNPRHDGAYCNRGSAKKKLGDITGALTDYTTAIRLNPQLDAAYHNRGILKWEQGDNQGAMNDYSRAIELNPRYDDAYCHRGVLKSDQGDSYAAILDFTLAIALDPKHETAFRYRGHANLAHGRTQSAFSDFKKAIELNPTNSQNYISRGHAHQITGELPPALADLRQALHLDSGVPVYIRYFIYNIRAKMGEESDARAELLLHLNQMRPDSGGEWPRTIGKFLTDQIIEDVFLRAADVAGDVTKTRQQRCEAWYFAAQKRLHSGDKATARDYLQKCRDTDVKNYIEYRLAGAELLMPGMPVP